jgi:sugar phosphate isomerase/epimerase
MKFILSILILFIAPVCLQAQSFGKTLQNTPGVVSFTYRDSFSKNVDSTLNIIKSLGVTNIEFSNLFGKTATELRKMLDDKGMVCTSFGTSYENLINKTEEVATNAKTLGAKYVRVAWIPHDKGHFNFDNIKKATEDFNKTGKILKENYGLEFCYHNHGFEFQPYEKGTFFDYFMQNTDPKYVSIEMDILWVFHPGADPVKLLEKYGKRVKLMHVKDLKKGVTGDFSGSTHQDNDVAVGTGQLDIPTIMKAARKSAIEYYYIEDESTNIQTQVPQSLAYLKKL